MTVDNLLTIATEPALAAAAGWLAGFAQSLLGRRDFLDRVVCRIARDHKAVTLEFLFTLDTDISAACVAAGVDPPSLEAFLSPTRRAWCAYCFRTLEVSVADGFKVCPYCGSAGATCGSDPTKSGAEPRWNLGNNRQYWRRIR